MILLSHILIALTSVLLTAFVYIFPSKAKLYVSYFSVGLTILSGTYLIFAESVNMVRTCATGLIYVALITAALVATRHKLAKEESK